MTGDDTVTTEKTGRSLVLGGPVCQGGLEPHWYLLKWGHLRTQGIHRIYGVCQGQFFDTRGEDAGWVCPPGIAATHK